MTYGLALADSGLPVQLGEGGEIFIHDGLSDVAEVKTWHCLFSLFDFLSPSYLRKPRGPTRGGIYATIFVLTKCVWQNSN